MKQFSVLFVSFLLFASAHCFLDKISSRTEIDIANLQAALATMSEAMANSNATIIDAVRSWSGNISDAYSAVRSRFVNSGLDLSALDAQIAWFSTETEQFVPRLEDDLGGDLYLMQYFANYSRELLMKAAVDMNTAATGQYKNFCLREYARMPKIGLNRFRLCILSATNRVEGVAPKVAALFAAATPSDVAWINQIDICSQPAASSTCVSNYFQNGFQSATLWMGNYVYHADSRFIHHHIRRCMMFSHTDLIDQIEKARSNFDNCLTTGV